MLLADQPDRHGLAVAVGEGDAEDVLAEEDALAVMPQGAVAQVGQMGLALVEPIVDGEVVIKPDVNGLVKLSAC